METMKIDNAAKKLEFINNTGTDKIVRFRANSGSNHVVPPGHSFVCFCAPILARRSEGYEESRLMMKKEYNSVLLRFRVMNWMSRKSVCTIRTAEKFQLCSKVLQNMSKTKDWNFHPMTPP